MATLRWSYGTVSCWLWTNSKYVVLLCTLTLKVLSLVFDAVYDAVSGHNLILMCHLSTLQSYNGYDDFAFIIFVKRIRWCRVGQGKQQVRLYCCVLNSERRYCCWHLMQYKVVISRACMLKRTTLRMMTLHWIHGTVSCWPRTNRP